VSYIWETNGGYRGWKEQREEEEAARKLMMMSRRRRSRRRIYALTVDVLG
jgi:hypothetical protein